MHNDYEYTVMHLLNIQFTICLIYLAFNNLALFLVLFPFQLFGAYWLWRGIRRETKDGNKQQ